MSDAPAELNLAETFSPPTLEAWRAIVDRDLKGADFERRLMRATLDDVTIAPLYTAADLPGDSGWPGAPPYTRGATSHAGWILQVDHGPCSDPAWVQEDIASGAAAIRVVASDGLDLSSLLGSATPAVYLAGADATSAARLLGDRRGSFGLDPLRALARDGADPDPALTSLAEAARATGPGQTAVEVATHVYHDAGASEAQDVASALATGLAYLRALDAAGLAPTEGAAQITFSLSVGCGQLEAIAKLRALRRCWSRVLEACGAPARGARIHARTAWRELTVRDPWVNLLRSTLTAFNAAVGGAERITPAPYDLVRGGAPASLARRLVRNTHHILTSEAHLGRVADPAGGSYVLERLTEEVAAAAWAELQAIEGAGGMAAAITSGWLADRIAAVHAKRAKDVARRKRPLTGVSDYPLLSEEPPAAASPAAPDGAFPRRRLAEPFEQLRARGDAARPRVFVAALGSLARHTARSTWITNLLAAGGIDAALREDGYPDAEAAAAAFSASGLTSAVIAGADATYAEHAAATAAALRSAGARRVVLAGRPGEAEEALRAAGVDAFVHVGVDVVEFLNATWEALS